MRRELAVMGVAIVACSATVVRAALPTPPEVWKDYDPDKGDFKEEIISEKTVDGVYYKDSYISAYVNGAEVRVYCKYAVKAGAKNAPGLLNVHGWMGGSAIDMAYVDPDRIGAKGYDFALKDWSEINEMAIRPKPGSDITKVVFARFKWVLPSISE